MNGTSTDTYIQESVMLTGNNVVAPKCVKKSKQRFRMELWAGTSSQYAQKTLQFLYNYPAKETQWQSCLSSPLASGEGPSFHVHPGTKMSSENQIFSKIIYEHLWKIFLY